MSADVLYFPNLSLPGPAWTNAVALYFDSIGIIAPSAYEPNLSDPLTAAFVAEGIVKPLFGGVFEHHADDEAFADSIIEWWRQRDNPGGETYDLYRIHRGKLTGATLLRQLREHELLKPHPFDDDWLVGPEPICMRIMSMLARRVVQAERIDAVLTDQTSAYEFSVGRNIPVETRSDRRIRAVTSLLPIGPWVAPRKIAKFKADNEEELRRFRGFVEQLIRRNTDDEAFEQRLRGAQELRDHLEGELQAIDARSTGSILAIMFARFAASIGEASLGSGTLDLFSGFRSRSQDARRRKEISREALVYAARAQSTMRARSSNELLA